ncbi:TlpA disulfide reductase family protein [Parapedobacter lycopersici]|uniref:TlpA disulfide reductase family protein n=1 Tax=Parapedobacter lycopersici TaxID=1864939 RepID=UPI003340D87C
MGKYTIIAILAILVLTGCSNDGGFVINGRIDNTETVQTVVLYEGDRKLDSAFLTENGQFRFQRATSQPRLLTLEAGKHRYHLILQTGDDVVFAADLANASDVYTVSGSELSTKIKGFAASRAEKEKFAADLEAEFAEQAANLPDTAVENLRQEFLLRYREGMQKYTDDAVQFAQQNDDLAGFYAMSTLEADIAETELVAYAGRIAGRWEDNATVRRFLDETAKLKRLAVGQPAPAFESLTPNNQPVKLSDFQGKYTLVDFWASWCVPCREENPNIVAQYHAYKDKGFTVLGVSLDDNPGAWMRAITQDGLEWTQVSDLRAWGSDVVELYRLQAIPTSYLLDPNGIIVAKNLRGPELAAFLKKTLD